MSALRASRSLLLGALLLMGSVARAESEAQLAAERDELVQKLVSGQAVESSIRSFSRLLERRQALFRATQAAQERSAAEAVAQREREAAAALREQQAEQQRKLATEAREQAAAAALALSEQQRVEAQQAFESSLDKLAGRYCHFVVDPKQRHFSGGEAADWGKVVRKHALELPGKNAFADAQKLWLYEIAGVRQRHLVRGDQLGGSEKGGWAVGDFIFLCYGAGNSDRSLPAPWSDEPLTSPLYGGRVSGPPRVADKGRFAPLHVQLKDLYEAISAVSWDFPEGSTLLVHLQIGEGLDGGRFLVPTSGSETPFVLEVPPGLPRRALVKPGEWLWLIVGNHRFDRQLKKLVLTALDVETHYLTPTR